MTSRRKKRSKMVIFSVTLLVTIATVGGVTYKICNANYKNKGTEHKTVLQANAQVNDVKSDKPKIRKEEIETGNDDEIKYDKLKNSKIIKGKNVNSDGFEYSIDRKEVAQMLSRGYKSDGKKYVFLTIDDGPSIQNTPGDLDILKSKNVKATFFLLGRNIETKEGAELLKREFNEGHAIGNHGYSHDPRKIYPGNRVNVDYFMNEIKETKLAMKKVLGDDFDTKVIRMPGGYMSREHYHDPNLNALNSAFAKEDVVNIDWNSVNGDAEGKPYTNEQMIDYVKRTSEGHDKVVVLMHDAADKLQSRQILPEIIDYFKSNGYEFKTISEK